MRTPFTADQIRGNCPTGRTTVTVATAPDGSTTRQVSRFVRTDADGAEISWEVVGADGSVVEKGASIATWEELRRHALFPADRTSRDEVTITTALGQSTCLHYMVEAPDATREFWFDLDRPGMPILTRSTTVDGDVSGTEVVSDVVA